MILLSYPSAMIRDILSVLFSLVLILSLASFAWICISFLPRLRYVRFIERRTSLFVCLPFNLAYFLYILSCFLCRRLFFLPSRGIFWIQSYDSLFRNKKVILHNFIVLNRSIVLCRLLWNTISSTFRDWLIVFFFASIIVWLTYIWYFPLSSCFFFKCPWFLPIPLIYIYIESCSALFWLQIVFRSVKWNFANKNFAIWISTMSKL